MVHCADVRQRLTAFVKGGLPPGQREEIERHVPQCSSCREELALLHRTWTVLPEVDTPEPPAAVRDAVLAYARQRAAPAVTVTPARWPGRPSVGAGLLWGVLALGAARAIDVRGAFAPVGGGLELGLVALFAAVAAVLGAVFVGRSIAPGVRAMLAGALGALGGYVLLTLVLPVNESVNICGQFVFGRQLSLFQLCSTYLFVTAGYAGVPMALVGYAARGESKPVRLVPREALVFAGLTVPLLLLQAGFSAWLIPASVVAGFAAGAVLGEVTGRQARQWVLGTVS